MKMARQIERVLMAAVAAALLPFSVPAQSSRLDLRCVEPFVTSMGYVLTPQCPPQPLAALVDDDSLDLVPSLDSLPPLDSGEPRRQQLRIYERRVPGTEIYITPSPLRNQWVYNPGGVYSPGGQVTLNPRDAANEFVFGVRVPF
jgi:hypothetical protein